MAIYISREDLLELLQSEGNAVLVMASLDPELNAKLRAGILQRAKYQPEHEQFPNRVMIFEETSVVLNESKKLTRAQLELPELCRLQWQPATIKQFAINDQILKCFERSLREGNQITQLTIDESVYIDLARPVGEIRFTYHACPEFQ